MLRKQLIQLGGVDACWQLIGLAKARIAADSGVVGKRCHAGHLGLAISGTLDAIDPVVGYFCITVEQQHVSVRVQAHASVDSRHKAKVVSIFQEFDAAIGGCRRAQPISYLWLRAAVIDDNQMPRCTAFG